MTFANYIYEGWWERCGVMVTWLQSHTLDESQEVLLLLELLFLYTSASVR